MGKVVWVAALVAGTLAAQQSRISDAVDQRRMVVLRGNVHPGARAQYDIGVADPSLGIDYATLMLKPSPAQQAELEQLLERQQDPSSQDYHKWLTPEQYAERFGASRDDIDKLTAWLTSQGLTVNDVARGRHWVTFSGTAERVGRAFRTEIHRYQVNGELHFANVTEPSVPEAFAGVVSGFQGLNDFRKKPRSIARKLAPENTSGSDHYMAPDDFATIYDVSPLYKAAIDGTGQKLVVVGQTNIHLSDIQTFRKEYNLPANVPQLVLFGTEPGIVDGDLDEANLDLDWAGAVARNATIVFAYSKDVDLSFQYAVDQNLGPVISESYGACEAGSSPVLRPVAQQANAQGITWLASSGDAGAADCDNAFAGQQANKGLAVDSPGTFPEVTSVGGTQFNEGNGNYWARTNNANGASALSYIPEMTWNESSSSGLASSGGGVSTWFAKPLWQNAPGVPNDNARDVPDVAFAAAFHDGYLGVENGTDYTFAGTSAATPVFAGIVTLLNQYLVSNGSQSQPGLGNINPNLYRLARTTTNVFHDITTGDNIVPCMQSSPNCSTGSFGYHAGSGYDLTTGLGSVDANNFVHQWDSRTGSTTLTLSANPKSIALNSTLQLAVTVKAVTGGGTPSGTVAFTVGDNTLGSASLSGSATATLTVYGGQLAAGNNTITAVYLGDGTFSGSSASIQVSATLPTGSSAVVPAVAPNPVFQDVPDTDSSGNSWFFTVKLKEMAGVATTLTDFTVGGVSYANKITTYFGKSSIAANATVTSKTVGVNVTAPATLMVGFKGVDAGGQTWTQQIPVSFYGPQLGSLPSFSMVVPVRQNPNADPSCQWAQQLYIEEDGGVAITLTRLLAGGTDISSQIQRIFGTTRLAPFGAAEGTFCWTGVSTSQSSTLELDGTDEWGGTWQAPLTISFRGPATAAFSATPATVAMSVPDASHSATAALTLGLTDSTQQWSVAFFPQNATTSWLQVSPLSGTGPAHLSLQASGAGLNKGVYKATLNLISTNATPQVIDVPVVFVVGASSTTSIGGVTNGASFKTVFAPGMIMSVFGTKLASSTLSAPSVPLPLTMGGVSATVNGVSAPLYYVSAGQLNVQIPYETGAGTAVLGVNNNGQVASYLFTVAPSAPGIFAASGALVPSATGRRGAVLSLYMTGEGDVTPPLATGVAPDTSIALKNLPAPRLPVTVTVGGVAAATEFVGIPYFLVGVTQINFTIPQTAPTGVQPLVVTVGGVSSAPVNLTVTP